MDASGAQGILLSICIPTYKRLPYLRDLLPALASEVEQAAAEGARIELLVSDNASPDGSGAYLQAAFGDSIAYYRNRVNIGADRNFLACIRRARGTYVWLFGDDEVILPGGVGSVTRILAATNPALVVLHDRTLLPHMGPVAEFADYAACLRSLECPPSKFVLSHGLITCNVFRKDSFAMRVARQRVQSNMGHMYGLLHGIRQGGRVVLLDGVIRVRRGEDRPGFDRWPANLCVKFARFEHYVGTCFGLAEPKRAAWRLAANLPVEWLSCLARWAGLMPIIRALRRRLRS